MLKAHALHHETGEPIPDSLVAKLEAARIFNNGFGTVEYTSCALVDQALHALDSDALSRLDLDEFEKVQLLELGMPQGVALRRECAGHSGVYLHTSLSTPRTWMCRPSAPLPAPL